MKKLKQEIKDSGRYIYGEFVKGGNPSHIGYQGFIYHNSDCGIMIVRQEVNTKTKETAEYIEICFPFEKNCPEFKVVATIYEEISLKELENIIKIFVNINI